MTEDERRLLALRLARRIEKAERYLTEVGRDLRIVDPYKSVRVGAVLREIDRKIPWIQEEVQKLLEVSL